MTTNRYAPPNAQVDARGATEGPMWRQGKLLVIRKTGALPHRCIKCNEPSVEPMRRVKLTWHSPGWYLLLLLAVLLYAIVAMVVRKSVVLHVGLCARHQRRVLWGRIVGWGGFALLVGLVALGMVTLDDTCYIIAAVLLLPWMIAAIVMNRLLLAKRIDETFVHAQGCGPAFLRSLPDRTWQ